MSYQSEQEACLRRLLREAEENGYSGEVGVPEAKAIIDLLGEVIRMRPIVETVAAHASDCVAAFGDRQ